ncbi:MAG: ABC transporter substrate-binding protein [Deltaproteobacteria bacterium]|nr:ABC transporter substrate-binding protein [Deltaproteobacteria bacterium]
MKAGWLKWVHAPVFSKKYRVLNFSIYSFIFLYSFPLFSFERVISLKPNITEVVFALGLGNKLVGVTSYCDIPPEAKKITHVSDYIQPSLEKVIALKPDLILTSQENSSRREIEFLIEKGYRVENSKWDTLDNSLESILNLGLLLGKKEIAEKLTQEIINKLNNIASKNLGVKKKVLFVVGQQPLIVAGSNNIFGDVAHYLGLENVAAQSKLKYPNYSLEMLVKSSPDLIIDLSIGMEGTQKSEKDLLSWWRQYPWVPAVKNDRVYFFHMEELRASPRFPEAVERISRMIR